METSVFAASSTDGGIGCWDLKTGKEQLRFKSCASPAHGLTVVGKKFLAASQLRNASASYGSIFYWSWTKPQVEVRSIPVESIKALAANSEGTYIVGGGASGEIYFWEVNTGKLLKKWHGHYRSVTCLVFCGDDSLLVSGSQDGSIRIWNLIRLFDDFQMQQGNTLYEHSFNEHTIPVTDIVVDYGGCNAMIVSASEDRTCKVWSLAMGTLLRSFVFPSAINALTLDPAGCVFYAGGRDSKIYVGAMNANTTKVFGPVSEQSKAVTCLAFCAHGNLLISGSEDGVVCVWDTRSGCPVRNFRHGKGPVNNIQVVRSRRRHGSSLPPPLKKYERSGDDLMDGIVVVDPLSSSDDVPAYSSFLSADLIKELQQGSAATEIENKRSLQMKDQWQKNFDILLKVFMEEQNGGSS